MNEKTFNKAKSRELRRFQRGVSQAIDQLLTEKFQQTRKMEEYRKYADACNFAKSLLGTVDRIADRSAPLFEYKGDRPNWEIYLSGLRRLHRDLPDSYLFRFVIPMFGLDDLQEKMVAYSGRWLDGLHAAHKFFTQAERYLDHLDRGERTLSEYQAEANDDLTRLYASLKTWETNQEVEGFVEAMAEFIDTTVEVVIAGPIQLYLMLGRDTFVLLFKTLSIGRLGELHEADEEYAELLDLHDFVHGLVADSQTLSLLREISARAGKYYAQNLHEEIDRLRAQLPTPEMKRSFVHRFEAGVLFRHAEEE